MIRRVRLSSRQLALRRLKELDLETDQLLLEYPELRRHAHPLSSGNSMTHRQRGARPAREVPVSGRRLQ
jgi:hypothetical protein